MIEAEIKNKVPKLESWEDILTSNVFGLLELINYKYLLEIVSKAQNYQGNQVKYNFSSRSIKHIKLWEKFKNIGEPDVLVTLDDDTFFIIEVKYFSREHNKRRDIVEEDDDSNNYNDEGQLKKYLDIKIDDKQSTFIIYLTADYQSLNHIQNSDSTSKECMHNIYHIHWDDFNENLLKKDIPDGVEKKVIDKIIEYLNFKGFTYWEGFHYKPEYNLLNTNIGGFYAR
jgi:hypothetical protein